MKLIDPDASFIGFHFFKIVYTRFYLDETHILSFFINYLSCHQKILCDSSFIENETPTGSSLSTLLLMTFSKSH
jgi:hypothetical protein